MSFVVRCSNARDGQGVTYTGPGDIDVAKLIAAERYKTRAEAEEHGVNCCDCRVMSEQEARDLDRQRKPVRVGHGAG